MAARVQAAGRTKNNATEAGTTRSQWLEEGMERFDVTIIGGGPVGLFGTALASLHGMKTKLIESLPQLGGQLVTLYPEKYVYDVAGFPEVLAKDLASHLIDQALRYHPTISLNQTVSRLEASPDGAYQLCTETATHETRTILITSGLGSFIPRRLPEPSAEAFVDHGIYYFVPPLAHFQGKRIVVIGGGDSALDWARAIADIAAHVTLVHRRGEFRGQQATVDHLQGHPRVTIRTFAECVQFRGQENLEEVVLADHRSHTEETLAADAVVAALGFVPDLGRLKEWGLNLKGGSIVVEGPMRTNRPGIYAAGDVTTYEGKEKLIATGFGEVGNALGHIRGYLDPRKRGGLPHSSNLKIQV